MKLYKKLLKRIEDGNPIYCNETFAKRLELEKMSFERMVNEIDEIL
jgi:hypothetical protein